MSKNSKELHLEDIGKITLKKFKQSKRISLKIKQDGEVLVTMPLSASYAEGLDFAVEQKDWIKKAHSRIQTLRSKKIITHSENNNTNAFTIVFKPEKGKTFKAVIQKAVLTIIYPDELLVEDAKVQAYIKRIIPEALKIKAKSTLPQLTSALAQKHGFKFSAIKLNKATTRWGSCNSNGSINLSVYLMLLPAYLIEYVILHELCHTIEMNHGPAFYALMDKVTQNKTRQYMREIKAESARWAYLKN